MDHTDLPTTADDLSALARGPGILANYHRTVLRVKLKPEAVSFLEHEYNEARAFFKRTQKRDIGPWMGVPTDAEGYASLTLPALLVTFGDLMRPGMPLPWEDEVIVVPGKVDVYKPSAEAGAS